MSSTPGPRWQSSSSPSAIVDPPDKFSYSVAASYIAKGHRYDPATHVFHFSPYNRVLQTRKKHLRPESGQDAFFVSRIGETGGVALGVADGVGGWQDSGVDPADFSHSFCDYMASAAYDDASARTSNPLTARQLMQKGYDAVNADPAVEAGGSTAVVSLLHPNGTMDVANLGDSGFIQLRSNAVHSYSEAQIHAFNTPYQLSIVPPSILARMATFGGTQLSDEPSHAEVTTHSLQHGDVIMFASDGVWDNLFKKDILRIVSDAMLSSGAWRRSESGIEVRPDLGAMTDVDASSSSSSSSGNDDKGEPAMQALVTLQSHIATQITGAAKAASLNTKLDGPFAKEVQKYYPGERWHGGKVDDICVVVAIVSQAQAAPPIKARL